jgi:epoxyqueuosine reductase QueG
MMERKEDFIKQKALEFGADAVGIASVKRYHEYAPKGYRPDDLLKNAASVVTLGKRRYTTGQWLASTLDPIYRARSAMGGRDAAGYSIAKLIEQTYGHPALFIGPAMFDCGLVPVMSLKLSAELSGLGSRSMAGAIILNEAHGLLGFVAVITTMELEPDGPLDEPVCPDRVCVSLWDKKRTTPCMDACGAIEGELHNGRLKKVTWYRQLCATRALTTMNTSFVRLLPDIMMEDDPAKRKYLAIGQARKGVEDSPGRGITGRCFECMRACPVNRRAIRLEKGEYND